MRRILLIVVFGLMTFPVMAQRYLPGMRGIQLAGGIIEHSGYFLHGGYSWYTFRKNRFAFECEYLQRNYDISADNIFLRQITGGGGYFIRLFSDHSKSFFAAIGAVGLIGFENINQNKLSNGAIITNKDHLIYGGAFSLEIEYYLDDRYVLMLMGKERVFGGSTVSNFHSQLGIGLKYILD